MFLSVGATFRTIKLSENNKWGSELTIAEGRHFSDNGSDDLRVGDFAECAEVDHNHVDHLEDEGYDCVCQGETIENSEVIIVIYIGKVVP